MLTAGHYSHMVVSEGIEPTLPGLQPDALPTELQDHYRDSLTTKNRLAGYVGVNAEFPYPLSSPREIRTLSSALKGQNPNL